MRFFMLVHLLFCRELPVANVAFDDDFCFPLEFLLPGLEERKVFGLWLLMGKRKPLIVRLIARHCHCSEF